MISTVFQTENLKRRGKIVKHPFPSTALIPETLWKQIPYESKKNFPKYLASLQKKYNLLIQSQRYLGRSPLRTSFQQKGQSLIRYSYRPKEESYQELRSLALAHGVSMNYIITLMIQWELLEISKRILSYFWRKLDPPSSKILDARRVLNLEKREIIIQLIGWPRRFLLERGSPRWA
ncbi:DUF1564 family protein [Leptospira sarikeiensis]|uniref:DUF1564 family protein n=1 Tax=Leptospira sarikeiensis TaxID=2484943 RepID=A0A4R9JZN4_9LEPT|nr:DUF1564 family protein [Leptospira sarikeiensis]TGL58842.1 DUF1564 family protein [Leptospira sarikeiensis]